jgi:hypothetical protein
VGCVFGGRSGTRQQDEQPRCGLRLTAHRAPSPLQRRHVMSQSSIRAARSQAKRSLYPILVRRPAHSVNSLTHGTARQLARCTARRGAWTSGCPPTTLRCCEASVRVHHSRDSLDAVDTTARQIKGPRIRPCSPLDNRMRSLPSLCVGLSAGRNAAVRTQGQFGARAAAVDGANIYTNGQSEKTSAAVLLFR